MRLLLLLAAACLASAAPAPPSRAVISLSAAPWDGAAYDLEIPLPKTESEPAPSLRVNLWGNPVFEKRTTVRFTGREDPGGGPGKGEGRASFQAVRDKSWPEPLEGEIVFDVLRQDRPVVARYELRTAKGRAFKGRFRAEWGGDALRGTRGAARR